MPETTSREGDCRMCGQPRAEHLGPPTPPQIPGLLGATERRPGSCLTTSGVHEHRSGSSITGSFEPSLSDAAHKLRASLSSPSQQSGTDTREALAWCRSALADADAALADAGRYEETRSEVQEAMRRLQALGGGVPAPSQDTGGGEGPVVTHIEWRAQVNRAERAEAEVERLRAAASSPTGDREREALRLGDLTRHIMDGLELVADSPETRAEQAAIKASLESWFTAIEEGPDAN